MSQKGHPERVLEELKEKGFTVEETVDDFRGFRILGYGNVEDAEEVAGQYDHTHVDTNPDYIIVTVCDHIFE